ncbi:MAG: sulfatase-like hydrolase/transferase [Luteitalea sp.]|nr:sulfatase-like hydrolase/transferase [Luteitalea sp.]
MLAPAGSAQSRQRPPNIVLIVSDNQAYVDIGAFGAKDAVTPNLDRTAADGIMATSFYVTSPACTPSRGSILTGRYPQRNGLYEMIRNEMVRYGHRYTPEEYAYSPEMTLGMDPREINCGEMMKSAGYATAAIGKWDSGRAKRYLPTRNGFDYFYGLPITGIDYWTHDRYGVPSMFRNEELVKEEGFSEELFTREALRFIGRNRDQPFFLYLAYHAPSGTADLDDQRIYPPQKYLDLYPGLDPTERRTEYLDMLPVLQRKMDSPRTEMFWKSRHSRAARVGNFKWIVAPQLDGLFDLANDPGEASDLSASRPDILAFVKARWDNWNREMEHAEPRGPFRDY